MPLPTLIGLCSGAQATAAPAQPVIEQAAVLAVYDSGLLAVQLSDGRVVTASQATDEPLQAGQNVWASDTDTSPVVYGSA